MRSRHRCCIYRTLSGFLEQRSTIYLGHGDLIRRDTAHDDQRVVGNHPQCAIVPSLTALLTTVCVPNSVHNAVDTPHRAENRSSNRPSQARDQQCADDGGVVLAEVLVRALGRVERKHGLLRRGRGCLDLLV
jgi:hypothetical protein